MFKRAKVVMLPTNKSKIYIGYGQLKLTDDNHLITNSRDFLPQHLYIISDDEIKEGDWYSDGTYINKADTTYSLEVSKYIKAKKIIATTDNLKGTYIPEFAKFDLARREYDIASISQSFIEKYITEYNKGHIISNVMVEYELPFIDDDIFANHNPILKVNPNDNTITIKKVKDSWSREEVIKLIKTALLNDDIVYEEICDDGDGNFDSMGKEIVDDEFNKWIEENL